MQSLSRTRSIDLAPLLLRAGFLAAALTLALPAWAQDSGSSEQAPAEEGAGAASETQALPPVETLTPETVVGRVGDKEITHAEVLAAAQQLGPQYMQNLSQVYPLLVQRLIDLELVTRAALAAGLEDEPAVQERLAEARTVVLRDYYLESKIEEAVTEEALAARYETFKTENPPETEVKARHILLEDEEAAKAVIADLEGGADFVELAKERSTGPSGPNGGDLGYFTKGMMVEEFANAAFELEAGSFTKEPVQTQFGWHVILLEDKRETTPPTLDEVRDQLTQEIQQETVQNMLTELREAGGAENLRDPEGEMTQN
ncbi:peptidylprolyl isomerase [Limibacillus halophilus]|jgi:peptidyl-prolyl cis-trans isomerase C